MKTYMAVPGIKLFSELDQNSLKLVVADWEPLSVPLPKPAPGTLTQTQVLQLCLSLCAADGLGRAPPVVAVKPLEKAPKVGGGGQESLT